MLHPETISVRVPGSPTGAYDEQGNPIPGADVVASATIKAFAPTSDTETAAEFGVQVISGGTVYGYIGLHSPADAILTIRGVEYQMVGELGEWRSPFGLGRPDGVQFAVRRAS